MKTALALSHYDVRAGSPARIEIEVTNTTDVIDGVTLIVDGVDPNWVHLDAPVVSLFPSTTATVGMTLNVPVDCAAGDYLVIARVVSTVDADRQSVHDFWLTVAPVTALTLDLRPSIVTAGAKTTIEATIGNAGNATAITTVTAHDPSREADCRVVPAEVAVPIGGAGTALVRLKGPRPWFGQAATRSIVVTAISDDVVVEEIVTFNQKPRIARGVLTFLILAGIIALWATVFLAVVAALSSGDAPAKAAATDFDEGGAANVPLAAIAGSAAGQVTAETTGEGVARITVEAFRVTPDGELRPAGSAATGEDGAFELPSLLPGTYKFRFTAEGYDELWYPAATSGVGADPVPIAPKEASDAVDVALTGKPGSLTGSIVVPESAQGTPTLTVIATQVVDEAETEQPAGDEAGGATVEASGDAPEPPVEHRIETTGDFALSGLPTPATYRIRVEGADFEPQEFEETLAGGETKVLNTVRLGASAGSVQGIVVDAAGNPLGGVTVTASSGELELTASTPTRGNVGEFLIVGLETPRTYVLDFALEGYSGHTVALELLAGEDRSGIRAVLVGGLGSVSGTARDLDGNPLGGVTVTVAGNGFTAVSSTLTTSGDAGAVGSYSVAEIPVPGGYTVTFEAEGYVPETVRVGFLAAGPLPGTDVVLHPIAAHIAGTVTVDGAGRGDVTVALSDGAAIRTTTTATSPAGAYSFADVEAGTYTLTFSGPGLQTRVHLIRVAAGDVLDRSIDLQAGG